MFLQMKTLVYAVLPGCSHVRIIGFCRFMAVSIIEMIFSAAVLLVDVFGFLLMGLRCAAAALALIRDKTRAS